MILKDTLVYYKENAYTLLDNELKGLKDLYSCYKNGKEYKPLKRVPRINDVLKEFVRQNGHQRRMREDPTLIEAVEICKKLNLLERKYANFEELYDIIETEIEKKVWGFGPLATYDLALRIGHLNDLEPVENVYLNSGAYEGAKTLLGRKPKHIEERKEFKGIEDLKSKDIEHYLCCYKQNLIKEGLRRGVTEKDFKVKKREFKLSNINKQPK